MHILANPTFGYPNVGLPGYPYMRSSVRQSCGSSMMPTATPPVFATRTAALQSTTTLSATGAGILLAFSVVQ